MRVLGRTIAQQPSSRGALTPSALTTLGSTFGARAIALDMGDSSSAATVAQAH
jgi:hypothetical protein